jgi:hypothetical protein
MARVDPIQTSFAGGEFGVSLFGRTDTSQYQTACATVENFLCRPYGSLVSTPGTEYINECKFSALGTDSNVRLLKFIFNRTDAYVIEFGDKYFRFYTQAALVVTSGTTAYEVAHTFTSAEVKNVQFAQLNDVIYLVHPSHKPQKLVRYGTTNWTLSYETFDGGPFLDDNITDTKVSASATASGASVTLTASATVWTVSSASTAGHMNTFFKYGGTSTNATTKLDEQGYVLITAVSSGTLAYGTIQNALSGTAPIANWAQSAWNDVNGWPASVTFHQNRLFYARTTEEPQKVWGSRPFIYNDFGIDADYNDDALNLQAASNEANEIKWLAAGKDLIAGTYGGEFVLSATDGQALTGKSATMTKQVSWGSESIIPKKIGTFFYYVQRFGKKIRELFYFWDLDTYKAVDKTIFSPHITGNGIVDMDCQANPETVLWCVRTDGQLATLTREVDQEIQGWARQVTDGYYESIAVIPSYSEQYDEVWVVVRRTVNGKSKRYIEVFKSVEVPSEQAKCFYVHSGLSYNAYTTTLNTAATITLSATGGSIRVTSTVALFEANDVGQRIRAIDSAGGYVGEVKITTFSSATVVLGTVKTPFDALTYAPGYWGVSVSTITGLSHLEAAEVTVLGDGALDKPLKTVSSGSITLASDYHIVNVGLPYTSTFKSLPIEAGSQTGTAQGKIQRINSLSIKVNNSYRGFKVGNDEMLKIGFRKTTTLLRVPEALYTGVIENIAFDDGYKYGAQVVIQNEDPLPVEILSIMPILTTSDK